MKKLLVNYIKNYIKLKLFKSKYLHPFGFTFYATRACNFRCSYCYYHKTDYKEEEKLNTEDTIRLIEIMRKDAPFIYITGGEPYIREDLEELLYTCKKLGFFKICVNTNSSLIKGKENTLKYIDEFIISLDCVNEERYDQMIGGIKGRTAEIKNNIKYIGKLQKEYDFKLLVNCVAMPDSLEDARDVLNFCKENNVAFSIVPQDVGLKPNPSLVKNSDYEKLIDEIVELKKSPHMDVWGSYYYYRHIRNFTPFTCLPTLVPRVLANGDVYYPCIHMDKIAGNLLKEGSYKKIMEKGIKKFGQIPVCKPGCFLACYIETNRYQNFPQDVYREYAEQKQMWIEYFKKRH